jgi:hypothetical protein
VVRRGIASSSGPGRMVRGPRKDQTERFGYMDNSDPFAAREDPTSPAAFENESFS